MKSIIKKGLNLLLGSALIASAFLQPTVTNAASVPFTQGAGYQQGGYDKDAMQPTDYNWSGHSRFNAVNNNLTTKWVYSLPVASYFAPIIGSDGTVYITTEDTVRAINPDGTLKWKQSLQDDATSSPILSDDGYIYITARTLLYAFDTSGQPKWGTDGSVKVINSTMSDISISDDGTLYIASRSSELLAVNPIDGSFKWKYNLGYMPGQASVDKDGNIYVRSRDLAKNLTVTSIDSSGNLRWKNVLNVSLTYEGGAYVTPLLDDQGNVYVVGSNTPKIYSLNTMDGSLNWSLTLTGYMGASPVYDELEKVIYIGSNGSPSFFSAINLDGTVKWRVSSKQIQSSPIIDNKGEIYVNTLYSLNVYSKSGELITSYTNGAGSNGNISIAEDGTLYLLSRGTPYGLYAVGGDINLPPIEPNPNEGTGLNAEYFNNEDLTDKKVDRVDSNIDFNWDLGSPDPLIDPETYSVRWTGKIQSERTGTHNFHINSDDGARLWINNQLIIDGWDLTKGEELQGDIWLEAGEKYDIKMEYFNGPTFGRAQLSWSNSDFLFKEVIPTKALFLN